MFEVFKKARQIIEHERELQHAKKVLATRQMDYNLLQKLCNEVSENGVEITIDIAPVGDNPPATITIKTNKIEGEHFETFKERFEKQHR